MPLRKFCFAIENEKRIMDFDRWGEEKKRAFEETEGEILVNKWENAIWEEIYP